MFMIFRWRKKKDIFSLSFGVEGGLAENWRGEKEKNKKKGYRYRRRVKEGK